MKLQDFKLERFFDIYEFTAPYLLCCSDCQSMSLEELLSLEPGSLEEFEGLSLGYTQAKGDPLLREEIKGLYSSISSEEILVHAGAEEAIFIFMNVALEEGDHVILQYPCYQSLHEVARAIGCTITPLELQAEEGGFVLDIHGLKDAIKEETRAIIINTPHNPTGYLLSKDEMEAIISISKEHDLLLFSDEVYRYLEYRREDRLPWACDLYRDAISLGVMSKSFGLAGLRIGWVATKNQEILEKMASFKDYTSICNSAPSEFLAALALRVRERILEKNQGIIKRNLHLLEDFFSEYEDLFTWYPPQAGPIAFPRLLEEKVSTLVPDLVEKKGVLLLPGSCYSYDDHHFRIGFGRENMEESLLLFKEYVEERWG